MRLYQFLIEARAPALALKYNSKILARASQDHSADITSAEEFLTELESQFGKYVEWVLIRWLDNNFLIEDLPRVKEAISQFEQKKRNLEKKDINQYKTLSDLEDAAGLLDDVKSARQQKQEIKNEGIRKIVDNERVLVARLLTKEAAQYYGRGTKWCTAGENDNRFNHYNNQGPIYFVIDKQTNEKFQIHYETSQCMDAMDKPYSYQKLLAIVPELKQLEPSIEHLIKSSFDLRYIMIFHNDKRWIEAEPYIMKNPWYAHRYAFSVIKGRWPEAEPYILKNLDRALVYARDCIGGRWPELESNLLSEGIEHILWYAASVIKGRWPKAEPAIMKDPENAIWYARVVIKGRWPKAEPIIMKDRHLRAVYTAIFGVKDRHLRAVHKAIFGTNINENKN